MKYLLIALFVSGCASIPEKDVCIRNLTDQFRTQNSCNILYESQIEYIERVCNNRPLRIQKH